MIGKVIALGFGVFKATDLAKEVIDRVTGMGVQPYLKSGFASALAVGAGIAYGEDWREKVVLASGIAGTAAVIHEGYAVLSTKADSNKAVVVQRAAQAATQAMAPSGPGRRIRPL